MKRSRLSRRRGWWRILLLLLVIGGAAGIFVGFGPPGLYAKSGSPEFCARCHVMQGNYETWFHNGGHRKNKCVDCHLPNDNHLQHFWGKSVEGMKDTYAFFSGRVSERIRLTSHGAAILEANCRRCHEQMVSFIKEDRPCWECHRRLSHLTTGAM